MDLVFQIKIRGREGELLRIYKESEDKFFRYKKFNPHLGKTPEIGEEPEEEFDEIDEERAKKLAERAMDTAYHMPARQSSILVEKLGVRN